MKTLKAADMAAVCFLAVLGLLTLWASTTIVTTMEYRLSPRALPYAVGLLILGCGIGLAIKALRYRGPATAVHWPDAAGVRTIFVSLIAIGLYNAFLNLLGLPVATFLYVAFTIWQLNRTKWGVALLTGLVCGVFPYWVFIRMLGLSFPEGILFKG
jgi:putative tricarboxylic transport membrane protein